jgi:protein SCO1/2
MSSARFPVVLAIVALAAAGAGAWLASRMQAEAPPALSAGTWLPQPRALPPFELLDATGAPFRSAQLRGQPSIVFFGFTHCPDICPTTLALLARVQKAAAIPGLRVVFVTIDPERDTPELVGRYARAFGEEVVGLTGSPAQIAALTQRFGVAAARVELPGGGYTMDHSSTLFLLDTAGRNVAVFTPPFEADRLTRDLRTLAARLHS